MPQSIPPNNGYRPKSVIYISKLKKEKGRDRVRPLHLYEEASRRFLPESEAIITIRKLDPLKVPLPHHLLCFIKDCIFKHRLAENDLAFEIAFIGYEYLNIVLHILGLGSISIMHYSPEEFSIKREKATLSDNVAIDKVIVRASGFTIYPPRKITRTIEFYGKFYNVDDRIDYGLFSDAGFIVDVYQLMKELKIKWDIDTRY